MPRLRKYTDGRGCYLSGHIPGIGFCTWQIGSEGLAYLADRGITSNNDALQIRDLREMIDRGLVGTAGSGTSPTPPAPPPAWVAPLADELIRWSLNGGVEALAKAVCPGSGAAVDSRPRCYSTTFLTWLGGLDPDTGLARFAGISAAEFDGLSANDHDGLEDDPLFGHLATRGAIGVMWRLSRLAGTVALRLRTSAACPTDWQTDPLLPWLFGRVKEFEDRRRASPAPTGQSRPVGWTGPRIVWAVDLQEVTAVLPSQLLPSGVTGVGWSVGRGNRVHPPIHPGARGRQIEESVSEPLRPSDVYTVELNPSGSSAGPTRWTIGCPPEAPLVLFHADGGLVDFEDPDPLSPGRYLALVRPGEEATVRDFPGFVLDEPVPVGPIGWAGWPGWNVTLGAGTSVPGYNVASSKPVVRWETNPPPDSGVHWLESCPVFVGDLPRINLEPPAPYRGAVLEVIVEGAGGLFVEAVDLTLGSDVALQNSEAAALVDLNTVPRLKSRFGRFRLKCHPAGRLDQPPLVLAFIRLPGMTVEYVPDPLRSSTTTAVRLAASGALAGLMPGPDTQILPDKARHVAAGSVVVRSSSPESAPGISVRSGTSDWEMRIRIGVSRAGLVAGKAGFEGWRPLPFEEIDLTRIGLGDRLRIEFHTPPVTECGRLVSRLPGRGELLVGEPLSESPSPCVFDIPLHRWRDGFGIGASGVIQIRGGAGWLDAARLTSADSSRPDPAPPPPAETWWQQLSSGVDEAVARGDDASTKQLITRCLEAVGRPECSPCASDLLPLTAARAALAVGPNPAWPTVRAAVEHLQGREDLPEAKLLAAQLDLRGGDRLAAKEWSLARLEEVVTRLPVEPGAAVVRAECWYRFAHSTGGSAVGSWQSCLKLSDSYLAAGLPQTGIAFSDALLLRDLARMMLGVSSAAEPAPTGLLPGHRGWVDAVRFAARFVRIPWHGAANPGLCLGVTAQAPSVLCPEDAALIRVLVGIATGTAEQEGDWSLVAGLPNGYFYALPLLRARYARYAGDAAVDEEYTRAWASLLSGDDAVLLDVIAAERP